MPDLDGRCHAVDSDEHFAKSIDALAGHVAPHRQADHPPGKIVGDRISRCQYARARTLLWLS